MRKRGEELRQEATPGPKQEGAQERKYDSFFSRMRRRGQELRMQKEAQEKPQEQRERRTARGIWQTSAGVLGLPLYGLAKVGDIIRWLLKQSKETEDIAKGWDEGMAFVGVPGHKS